MRVYIAAPWVRKREAIEAGEKFIAAGHEITSRWFAHEGDPSDSTGIGYDPDIIRAQAVEDWRDVEGSDVLVVLNLQKSEGKAVETGIALATGIPIIAVGGRSNIFQILGEEVETVDDALALLAGVEIWGN